MQVWILQEHKRNDAKVNLEHIFTNAMLGRVQEIKSDNFSVYVISAKHFKQIEEILPERDVKY